MFLKKKNENFFQIISQAEKLFRDEYFEQTVIQTRRFAENICKDLLGDKVLSDDTFDSMINKIKDNSFGNIRMQEFTDDLYFLKKHGNTSAHSLKHSITPEIALECLERAYEISVFYSHIKHGVNKKLEKTLFSEELLITGKQSGKASLKDRYVKELKKSKENSKKIKPQKNTKPKNVTRLKSIKKRKNKTKKLKLFFIFLVVVLIIGCLFFNPKSKIRNCFSNQASRLFNIISLKF